MFSIWIQKSIFLPFGTLLTGSSIGTNNEKSTKVWTGDIENAPVELVAYNSDGTLPTNQVYDDIVTDANIAAPAIVDINSNNHAEFNYKYSGSVVNTNVFMYSNSGRSVMLSDSGNLYYAQSNYNSTAETSFTTSIAILDIYDHSSKLQSSLPIVVNAMCDISTVVPNTLIACGFNIGNNNARAILSYVFVDKSTLAVSQVYTIPSFAPNSSYTQFIHDVQLIDNFVYFRYFSNNTSPACRIGSYKLTGSTMADATLSNQNIQDVQLNLMMEHIYVQTMEDCGYPNKTIVIGQDPEHPGTSNIYSHQYYVITYENGTVSISDRQALGNNETSDYQYLPYLNYSCKIYHPSTKWYYLFYTNFKVYNASNAYRGYSVIKFKFNGAAITDLTHWVSDESIGYHIRRNFMGARVNVNDNTVDIIWIDYYNTPSTVRCSRYSLTTFKELYKVDTSISSSGDVYGIIIDTNMIKMIHRYQNPPYLISLAPYYQNTYDVAGSCKVSSTKALAVTSGNIGDTVRIAYEGTYHVPGVPTGSIYNTDTSYAIAKKSGVLTVSEPQQTSKVYYGSYVGDGTKGTSSSNPMSITFPFKPRLLIMIGYSTLSDHGIYRFNINAGTINTQVQLADISTTFKLSDGALRDGVTNDYVYHKLTSDGLTYSWYTTSSNTYKFDYVYNIKDCVYHYIAYE